MSDEPEIRRSVRDRSDFLNKRESMPIMPLGTTKLSVIKRNNSLRVANEVNNNEHSAENSASKPANSASFKPVTEGNGRASNEPTVAWRLSVSSEEIRCRLFVKESSECPWVGPPSMYKEHCRTHHAYSFSFTQSNTVKFSNVKTFTDTVSVRFIGDDIIWCYHSVSYKENPAGVMYWTAITPRPGYHYYINVCFYMKGNPLKKMNLTEAVIDMNLMQSGVEHVKATRRCVVLPLNILTSYFSIGDSFMDQIICEASIRPAEKA